MEIRLTDNSKISVTRLVDDRVRIELYQPKTLRDGHGFTLVGSAVLEGEVFSSFLAELSQEPKREVA
jgi:hypothetical protein